MSARWQNGAMIAMAFVLGALAYLLLGQSPGTVEPEPFSEVEWRLLADPTPDLSASDARWQQSAPWGAAPVALVQEAPPAPPVVPVGISRERGRSVAIFMIPGAGEVRVAPGGLLPDGGQVHSVSGLRVVWTDRDGQRQQREMFTGLAEPP